MTKTLEIGHDYASTFGLAKGCKMIYNGGISWTGIAPDGKSMTMDSQQQTDAATKAINFSRTNMGGLI